MKSWWRRLFFVDSFLKFHVKSWYECLYFYRENLKNIDKKTSIYIFHVVFRKNIMKIQILILNLRFSFERFGCCQVWQLDSELFMYFFQNSSTKYKIPVKESLTARFFHVVYSKNYDRKHLTQNEQLSIFCELIM